MNNFVTTSLVLAETMEPRLFDLDLQLLADAVLIMIAVFALFIALSYFLFEPARKMLQNRQQKIQSDLDTAVDNKTQAEALKSQYEEKLKVVDKEVEEILSDARKKAIESEARIIAEAKEEASRIMERAAHEAQLEKKKVADEVKSEMIQIASLMAGKVVANSIDTTIQDGLIDETLKEIGESTWLS